MRTPRAFVGALAVLAFGLSVPAAHSQSADGWEAYPSFNEASAVASSPDGLWAASDGGVFFYAVLTGEIEVVTSVDGLTGGPVGALAFDEARGVLWIGYEEGVFERLDVETLEVKPYFAITRADQYASRGLRRIDVEGDLLYLSTDFGIVVFDVASEQVRSAYTRLGDAEAGTPVNDVLLAATPSGEPGLWAANDDGLHYASLGAGNLQAPSAWTRSSFPGPAFSVAEAGGTIVAGGGPDGELDLYRRSASGTWDRLLFTNNPITTLLTDGDEIRALAPTFVYLVRASGGTASFYDTQNAFVQSGLTVGPDGALWVTDDALGLFRLPSATPGQGRIEVSPDPVVPPGPLSSDITDLDVSDDGVVWLVTERLEAAGYAAVSRFEDGTWTSFRNDDTGIDIPRASFVAASVGPEGTFYAGSGGDGLAVFPASGERGGIVSYDETDSSLRGAIGDPDYVVSRDVAFEDGMAWVINSSGRPLHRFDGQDWEGYTYPSGIPATAQPFRITIDEFGQKWLALGPNGLGVWNTGADDGGADDQGRAFTGSSASGIGLPGPDVRDVVVDGRGRVWLGTDRGVAYVFSPGSAFSGDPSLATPQWPLTEDGSSFLLRDVEVFDLEVDPAGQIWVGTSSGAYLINASGNGLVRTITAETSPLPSDGVFSVAVDAGSGRVYFVTSEGLFSAPGDATSRDPSSESLTVAPQPFRPAESTEGVVIRGLRAPSTQLRVMTVAGDVVFASDVAGGSFRWDGRDQFGQPVPSGVYLIAAAGSDGSTLVGKVAVLR